MSQNQDRVRDLAFNELTATLSMYSRFVPLAEREAITRRILAVVVPEIQAQASEDVCERLLSATETVSGGNS